MRTTRRQRFASLPSRLGTTIRILHESSCGIPVGSGSRCASGHVQFCRVRRQASLASPSEGVAELEPQEVAIPANMSELATVTEIHRIVSPKSETAAKLQIRNIRAGGIRDATRRVRIGYTATP